MSNKIAGKKRPCLFSDIDPRAIKRPPSKPSSAGKTDNNPNFKFNGSSKPKTPTIDLDACDDEVSAMKKVFKDKDAKEDARQKRIEEIDDQEDDISQRVLKWSSL